MSRSTLRTVLVAAAVLTSSACKAAAGGEVAGSPALATTTVTDASSAPGPAVEPSVAQSSNAPVTLSDKAQFGDGVTARIFLASLQKVAGKMGVVTEPGLILRIVISNGSPAAISLTAVDVTLSGAAGVPLSQMADMGSDHFIDDELPAGATVQAEYHFALPADYTNPCTVTISQATTSPLVVFTGDAPI